MKALKKSVICVAAALVFVGCEKKVGNEEPEFTLSKGVLVLNQGNWGESDATVSHYDSATGEMISDVFSQVNGRSLGDTPQTMRQYGSKIYITVTDPQVVEVVDARTFKSLKKIESPEGKGSPRQIVFDGPKAYVTLYDGYLARIDTTSLMIEETVAIGSKPEGMAISNGKIYVANSDGYWGSTYQDSNVSVVDKATFTELKKIDLSYPNPNQIVAGSNGKLYVACWGDYSDNPNVLMELDPETEVATPIEDESNSSGFAQMTQMTSAGGKIYGAYHDYNLASNLFTVYDMTSGTVETDNFITDNTFISTPGFIWADTASGNIFVGDSMNSTMEGKIFCFSSTGVKSYELAVGFNPMAVVPVE